jgi:hypothetical protein
MLGQHHDRVHTACNAGKSRGVYGHVYLATRADFQRQLRLELAGGPGDELAGVAAVGPGQLDRREGPPQVPQQRPGGVAVLHGRGGDQRGEPQADRVDGEVPMIAAVGALVRPAAARTRSRRSSCIRSADPSARHLSVHQ